jgi:hypothetical protein
VLILYKDISGMYPFIRCLYPFYELKYDGERGIQGDCLKMLDGFGFVLEYLGVDGGNIIFNCLEEKEGNWLFGYEIIHLMELIDLAKYFIIVKEGGGYYELPTVGYINKDEDGELIKNEYYEIKLGGGDGGNKIGFFLGCHKVLLDNEKKNKEWYLEYDSLFIVKSQTFYFYDSSFLISSLNLSNNFCKLTIG